MHQAITKLLSIASEPIGGPVDGVEVLNRWGSLGKELAELLTLKNGFYAFESALLVRPLQNEGSPLGLLEWNAPGLWKGEYIEDLADLLFFAEDIFGGQYCIQDDNVCAFDPEAGRLEVVSSSLGNWAKAVLADVECQTGYPWAHDWQLEQGTLPPGMRLQPKIPFVLGGEYEVENLYSLDDVEGMLIRASIANQIRRLPDGTKVVFKLGESFGPESL